MIYPYKYICQACNRIAFYMLRVPLTGEKIMSEDFRLLTGKKPVSGEKIICGACGAGLPTLLTSRIEKNYEKLN